jgi:murein DD-endopeptidase MepM/ murein hydrolase activator NlpD
MTKMLSVKRMWLRMHDVIVRPRYSRNTSHYRKKRTQAKESGSIGRIVKKQLLISVMIFVIVFCAKLINTSVTNFITDKIKWVLSWNMDINDIYGQINDIIAGEDNPQGSMEAETKEDIIEENKGGNLYENADDAGLEFILPVEGSVASYFGEMIDPVTNIISFHSGIDIEGHGISDIKAVEDGEVIEVSECREYGKYLKIKHAGGIITLYAHCSKIFVEEGTKTAKGGIIAEIGNDKIAVGTHLHFEVWKDGKPVDPLEFVKVPMSANKKNEVL